jgi:hypothetical protein
MILGSLFSGEFTLGLIAQIRISSAGKGFSNAFNFPSLTSPNHLACFGQYHRHSGMDLTYELIGITGNNRASA